MFPVASGASGVMVSVSATTEPVALIVFTPSLMVNADAVVTGFIGPVNVTTIDTLGSRTVSPSAGLVDTIATSETVNEKE